MKNNDDGLPPAELIAQALIRVLSEAGRAIEPKEIYTEVAQLLKLTKEQLSLKRRTRDESLFQNRVQAVRDSLVKRGLIEHRRHGFWSLTRDGELYARKLDEPFDLSDLF